MEEEGEERPSSSLKRSRTNVSDLSLNKEGEPQGKRIEVERSTEDEEDSDVERGEVIYMDSGEEEEEDEGQHQSPLSQAQEGENEQRALEEVIQELKRKLMEPLQEHSWLPLRPVEMTCTVKRRRWRKKDILLHGFKRKRKLKAKKKTPLRVEKPKDNEEAVVKWGRWTKEEERDQEQSDLYRRQGRERFQAKRSRPRSPSIRRQKESREAVMVECGPRYREVSAPMEMEKEQQQQQQHVAEAKEWTVTTEGGEILHIPWVDTMEELEQVLRKEEEENRPWPPWQKRPRKGAWKRPSQPCSGTKWCCG